MLAQHQLVIHFVNMVASQNDHILNAVAVDDVDILGHRISRALIPAFGVGALRRGQNIQKLIALCAKKAPATLQMPDQTMGFILGRHRHFTDAGIQGIRQGKVDNPRLAAKIHRRFGADIGQFIQSAATPSCQHEGH